MEEPILIAESKSARKQIRHEGHDPYNRLHSIAEDAAFVAHVAAAYPQFKVYRKFYLKWSLPLRYTVDSQSAVRCMVCGP